MTPIGLAASRGHFVDPWKAEFDLDRTFRHWTAARRAAAGSIVIDIIERPLPSQVMMTPSRKYEEGKRRVA